MMKKILKLIAVAVLLLPRSWLYEKAFTGVNEVPCGTCDRTYTLDKQDMEHELKEMLVQSASEFLSIQLNSAELPDFVDDWVILALPLFSTKSIDNFWATSLKLRKDDDFVQTIKELISQYMAHESTEKQIHYNAQCIIGLVCDKILIFTKSFEETKEPPAELQLMETTGPAHRYYIGFVLLQLGKKFGHRHFINFKTNQMETPGDRRLVEHLWWTAGINRGGLIFCNDIFYSFFKTVLSIEDIYFQGSVNCTNRLRNELINNKEILKKWEELPWNGATAAIKTAALREAVRLHVGGRTRAFVKFVKDNHKGASRMARCKKPLREQLANNSQQ